jgi:hypothetical protein
VIGTGVALLAGEAPLERLNVIDHRLGLDGQIPVRRADHRVPRAQVPLDGQRHLGAPSKAGVDSKPKPRDQALLPDIPDRIAGRIRAQTDVESYRSADGRVLPELRWTSAADGPRDGRSGQAASSTHVRNAQAGAASSSIELHPQPRLIVCRCSSGPGHGSTTRGHIDMLPVTTSPSVIRASRARYDNWRRPGPGDGTRNEPSNRWGVRHASGMASGSGLGRRSAHDAHAWRSRQG